MKCWTAIPLPWVFATSCPDLRLVALLVICAISACSRLPERVEQFAYNHGMVRSLQSGQGFQHVIYRRGAVAPGDVLHVYIEGDGRPWGQRGQFPSADPTPGKPLALHLMAKDPAPALYLGRPCYFGLATRPGCNARYWTHARYSPEVVESMALALKREIAGEPAKLILIGYSGGGSLAVLLAPYLEGLEQIVTLAANLDTEGWTQRHGYEPLTGSLNPIQSAELTSIKHRHMVGALDTVVAAESVRRFAQTHGGDFQLLPDYSHTCCWEDNWPALLHNKMTTRAPNKPIQAED